jgi:hypothetical protein
MANFEFDLRGLPSILDSKYKRDLYHKAVKDELVNNYEVGINDEITVAAVVGILLTDEYFDAASPTFSGAIRSAREEILNKVPSISPEEIYRNASSDELTADALKKYQTDEIKDSLKNTATETKALALSKIPRARVAGILGKLSRLQLDTLLEKFPNPKTAEVLKKVSLADFPAEFVKISDAEGNEMFLKATDKDISDIIQTANRNELDMVLAKMKPAILISILKTLSNSEANQVSSKEVYRYIAEFIDSTPKQEVFYQEFAGVGRYVISRTDEIPFGHPRFDRQIKIAFDQYVSGAPTFDSLDLPPLTGAAGTDTESVPGNIKAVAMVYAAYQLDVGMRMIDVVDRVNEIFHNGQLPFGFDSAGKAIDDYNWSSEDRMNSMARRTHYSRVLGVAGGDVSKEVQPNIQFENLFIRFLSSLAEYDRQQRVSDIVTSSRPRNLTGEYVRKAGRDLAANLSLYGWAATHFAARRLRQHIESALNILKQPSVQKAYGVTNLYQVIERVASTEFNSTPNIVKHRTMAESGKQIIDIVAKYAHVWNKSDGTPLFTEIFNGKVSNSDISDNDRTILLVQTQYWLAVNGIKDAQVDQYSEPEMSKYAPSLPSFGSSGSSSGTSSNTSNPDQMDKIKQMVGQGQMPSLDQLQGMFNGSKMGV